MFCIFTSQSQAVPKAYYLLSLSIPTLTSAFIPVTPPPNIQPCSSTKLAFLKGDTNLDEADNNSLEPSSTELGYTDHDDLDEFIDKSLVEKSLTEDALYRRFRQLNEKFDEQLAERLPTYNKFFLYFKKQWNVKKLPAWFIDKPVHFDHLYDNKESGFYRVGKLLYPGTGALWSGNEAELRRAIYHYFARDFSESRFRSVLSVGCGGGKCLGTFHNLIASEYQPDLDLKLYGMDFMPGPLADASTTLNFLSPEIEENAVLNIGDATDIDSLRESINGDNQVDAAMIHFVNHETPREVTLQIFENLRRVGVKKVYWLDLDPKAFMDFHDKEAKNGNLVKKLDSWLIQRVMLLSEPYFLELDIARMVSDLQSEGWTASKLEFTPEIEKMSERFPVDAYIFETEQ